LLALFGKNKDIVYVAKYDLYINFNKTIVRIYYDSFISGIIQIAFE